MHTTESTRDRRQGPLIVVGMHRSGTSFLTGSLQLAGLELGKHSTWNPFNKRGNRENEDFVAFHDAVLKARGATWKAPPPEPVAWTEAETARARELAAGFAGVANWGFKDPRALLMAEAWRALLPTTRFVGIFRHPVAVARSLASRGGENGMKPEKAFELWTIYNTRLLALLEREPFPLLCFDDDAATLQRKLNEVLLEVGLRPLGEERFYTEELQRQRHPVDDMPAELAPMYAALARRAW